MYKFLLIFLILFVLPAQAFELDPSVDEEIRKNYNPSAIEDKLPALPKTSPNQSSSSYTPPPKNLPSTDNSKITGGVKNLPSYSNVDKSTAIRLKRGTKFRVKSNSYLADTTQVGTRVSFVTIAPVYQKFVTVPAGTTLYGTVIDSHLPQIAGNGGLIEVLVDGVAYKGQNYLSNGKVTKANHKKIFFNNIKGKHQYWKGVSNQVGKGQNFYQKTRRASSKLSNNPITNIISPIPTIFGAGVYFVNLVGSPIIAVGTKGGRISIPAGSEFEFKLRDDVYLQY